jgi:hypothetical protein
LVSASAGGTLLVWDLTGRLKEGRLPPLALQPKELEQEWEALASEDAARAQGAVWTLVASEQALPFLEKRLQPARHVTPEHLKQLIANLDDDSFDVREKAAGELAEAGEVAAMALNKALASMPSPEARVRIMRLLAQVETPMPPRERLRDLRGVRLCHESPQRNETRQSATKRLILCPILQSE